MSIIKNIVAREILDSRGYPTIEVDVHTVGGIIARASSPSGASIGSNEARELRDGDKRRFFGKGVLKAVHNVNTAINDILIGRDVLLQKDIDATLIELDATGNKSRLGANAIIAVSMAALKAAAIYQGEPLFRYINKDAFTLPVPLMNILNGGIHAHNDLDIQEFMIMPVGASNIKEAVRIGAEIFHTLKIILSRKNMGTNIGDEGGFAPEIKYSKDALEIVLSAIEQSGYKVGKDVALALDVAASELYHDGVYHFKGENRTLNAAGLVKYYEQLVRDYPICSIEDGMAEQDFEGWMYLTNSLGNKIQLVGDDVFVTNKRIFSDCADKKIANAILIKPNQIGTITETFDTINCAHSRGYNCVMSHRSGETEETIITHLAVASRCNQIKIGSLCRVDRTAKYNELIRIEETLGQAARFASVKQFNEMLSI
jgi:enolase